MRESSTISEDSHPIEVFPRFKPIRVRDITTSSKLSVFPVIHNSLLTTDSLLQTLNSEKFDNILIEAPNELRNLFIEAIDRFPTPTVIHEGFDTHIPVSDQYSSFLIYFGEPHYSTIDFALNHQIPFSLIDQYVEEDETNPISVSPYSLVFLEWETIFEKLNLERHNESLHFSRSMKMAKKIQLAFEGSGENILVVVGLAHVPVILSYLKQNITIETDVNLEKIIKPIFQSKFDRSFIPSTQKNFNPRPSNFNERDLENSDNSPHPFSDRVWQLSDVSNTTLYLKTYDFPYMILRYYQHYQFSNQKFNFLENLRESFIIAESRYKENYPEKISVAAYLRLFQYLRNLQRTYGQVFPDLMTILLATKGCTNDDYTFELYKLLTLSEIPNTNALNSEISFVPSSEQQNLIKMTFRRRIPKRLLKKMAEEKVDPFDFASIPLEKYPGQWAEIWDKFSPYSTVSYPPEDIYIENYFHLLRKKALDIIREEKSSVKEFKTSLEDGIDWRETTRKMYEHKIYVKKIPNLNIQVGALIVAFYQKRPEDATYTTMLYAEHELESDLGVVSTVPGETFVGPGITRIKIAGLVSVYPPTGIGYSIPDIRDDFISSLLLTGMNMSISPLVVLVSPRPPTSSQKYLVESEGFTLIYLPLKGLNQRSFHRLRTMHLLAHPDLREVAREFIGF